MKEFIFKYKWALFVAIVSINFLFRFLHVGENSFWLDECYSVQLAQKSIKEIIHVAKVEEPNPPLYGIALHYWTSIFGDSETGIRSLSVLASSFTAGFLFLLCLNFFNWQTSVFASIMFFTSNELYYYSQEARTYALILIWAVLSYYLFLSLMRRPTYLKAILFAVFNVFIFYSHFLACFVIIGEIILFPFFAFTGQKTSLEGDRVAFTFESKKKLFSCFSISALIALVCLWPWKDRTIFLLLEGGKAMWLAKPTYSDFKQCVYDFFNSKALYQVQVFSIITLALLLCFKKLRSHEFSLKHLFFALVIGPGLLYLNYLIAGYTPIFLKRYVLFTIMGFILFYAYMFSLLNFNFFIKLGLFIVLAAFSFSKITIPREALNDYNKAVPYLKGLQKNKTTLIINDLQDVFAYYYDKEISRIPYYHEKNVELYKHDVYTPFNQTWPEDEDFSKYKDIYYTRSFFGYYDPQETIPKRLSQKYNWIEDITGYKGIKISHYINPEYKPK